MNPLAEKLAQFCEDVAMYQAVKNMLLGQFDMNKMMSPLIPDEELGQFTRSRVMGQTLLLHGFKEIDSYRKNHQPESLDNDNPAA